MGKRGLYQLRLRCQWAFVTQHQAGETEVDMRGVPGLYAPGLNIVAQESRIWKDIESSVQKCVDGTTSCVFWHGTSIFLMDGYKEFWVKSFPFDRQVICLPSVDFVWRTCKEDDNFFRTMKIS